jgi:hypothetical protein
VTVNSKLAFLSQGGMKQHRISIFPVTSKALQADSTQIFIPVKVKMKEFCIVLALNSASLKKF